MHLKKDLMYNEKTGKSWPVAPKCRMVENLHRINRHRPKKGLNLRILWHSNSPGTVTNMHKWFYGYSVFWTKVTALLKSYTGRAKNWKKNKIFIFEKYWLPPPLLHSMYRVHTWLHKYLHRVYVIHGSSSLTPPMGAQHIVSQGNILQQIATHWNTLRNTTTQPDLLWLRATILQETATHWNTLQHTATQPELLWLHATQANQIKIETVILLFFG